MSLTQEKVERHKGVEGLIDVENPNRATKKNIKAKDVDVDAQVTLSRRERYVFIINTLTPTHTTHMHPSHTHREEVEKQRAAESYRKLHEAGKTDEAMRDLARLAIIRQQREEAAKKREAERKGDCSLCR